MNQKQHFFVEFNGPVSSETSSGIFEEPLPIHIVVFATALETSVFGLQKNLDHLGCAEFAVLFENRIHLGPTLLQTLQNRLWTFLPLLDFWESVIDVLGAFWVILARPKLILAWIFDTCDRSDSNYMIRAPQSQKSELEWSSRMSKIRFWLSRFPMVSFHFGSQ